MKKVLWGALLGVAIGATGCQSSPTTDPSAATATATLPTISAGVIAGESREIHAKWSAEITAALDGLSSRDAAKRAAALEQLAHVIEQNNRDASMLMNIAGQFKANSVRNLTSLLATQDLEARALIASLMNFQEALSRFLLVAAEETEPRREMLIHWGLSPEGAKVLAVAFSSDSSTRVDAAHMVVGIDGQAADWVLARLIDDAEREVSLTAINAAWDREPSPDVVDALWQKAVEYPLTQYRINMGMGSGIAPRVAVLHGRTIQLDGYDYSLAMRMMDGDVATDLLVAYKSDVVEKKITDFMDSLAIMKSNPNMHPFQMLSSYNGSQGLNFERLLMAYRPKAAVVYLVGVVASNFNNDGWEQMMNNQMYRCSTRVDALGILAKLTDQDKDDFNLARVPQWGNRWMLAGTLDNEEKAARKMLNWWKIHYKDYGAKSPDINDEELPKNPGRSWGRMRGRMMW